MRKMVGFRKVAVPACQDLDRTIVKKIVHDRLPDFEAFCRAVMAIPRLEAD